MDSGETTNVDNELVTSMMIAHVSAHVDMPYHLGAMPILSCQLHHHSVLFFSFILESENI